MTTGATGQLGLALPVQGELSGTWGDTVNNGITQYTNIAIAATLTLTNDGAVTLANTTGDATASNITSSLTGAGTVTAQFAIVRVTGTLTTAKVVTAPSYSKTYTVVNAATGGIVTFKASGQTGVSIAVGESAFVYFNGTDYVKLAGTATAGAAAGSNTQVQFNSSGALAGSSAFTWDGANIVVNATTPAYYTGTSNLAQISINRSPSTGTIFNASQSAAFMNIDGASGGSSFQFATASAANTQPSERMRLTGAGSLVVGGTEVVTNNGGITATTTSSGSVQATLAMRNAGTGNGSGTTLAFRGVTNAGAENDYAYLSMVADDTTAKTGSIRFSTGSGSSPVERARIDSSGNFTVNSGSQYVQLAPTGNITGVHASGSGGDTILSAINGVSNGYQITVTTGNAQTYKWHNGGTQSMTLDSSGNLGIGTTSPSSYGKFAVVGSTSQGSSFVSTGTNAFSLISAVSTGATMYLGVAGTAAGTLIDIGGISDNATYFGSRTNTVAQLISNNTVRATISAAGGFSVGTTSDPGAGAIYATGNITAYYSDARLKTVSGKIENALDKVGKLSGVYYTNNDTAKSFGYDSDEEQVGVIAQEVEAVLPQIVKAAPFDLDQDGNSKSGENYKTVQYDKLVPLLIEAINELRAEVKALKGE